MGTPLAFGTRTNDSKFDFYPTPEYSTEKILSKIKLIEPILEPANGLGSITKVVKKYYQNITTFDINLEAQADKYLDFFNYNDEKFNTIITNPPFKYNHKCEFIKKALESVNENGLVIMFLKLTYLESRRRKEFLTNNPPKHIFVHSERVCLLDGYGGKGGGVVYAWFVWEKGYKGKSMLELI